MNSSNIVLVQNPKKKEESEVPTIPENQTVSGEEAED